MKERELQLQSYEDGGGSSDGGGLPEQPQHQPCSVATCGAPAIELRWLMSRILLQQQLPLPSAAQMRVHPFFWSSRRTAQFMVAAAQFLCEQELIVETLKSFCGFSSSFFSGADRQQQAQARRGSAVVGGVDRRASTVSDASACAQGGSSAAVAVVDQHDPDGVAARAAEKLRGALGGSPFAGLGSGMTSSLAREAAVAPNLQDAYDESSHRRSGRDGQHNNNSGQQDPNISAINSAFDAAAHSSRLMRTESMVHFGSGVFSSPVHDRQAAGAASSSSPARQGSGIFPQQQQQSQQDDEEEVPPNSIARMLNCSTTLY